MAETFPYPETDVDPDEGARTGISLWQWVAGLLPALLGFVSLLNPGASSSLDLGWALAAIAWGAGFVAVAELTKGATTPPETGSATSARGDTPPLALVETEG